MRVTLEIDDAVMRRYVQCEPAPEELRNIMQAAILAWIDHQTWVEKARSKGWNWERDEKRMEELVKRVRE